MLIHMVTKVSQSAQKVCIAVASGCPRSFLNTGVLFKYFEANGWSITSDFRQADLVLFAGCGVDETAEIKSFNLLRAAKRRTRPGAKYVIYGCLAGMFSETLESQYNAQTITVDSITKLDSIINAKISISEISGPNDIDEPLQKAWKCFSRFQRLRARQWISPPPWRWPRRSYKKLVEKFLKEAPTSGVRTFNIQIGTGCLSQCTYCGIRFAIGTLRSKHLEDIVCEFEKGLAAGYEWFRLVCGDVGAYGQDINSNLVELLKALLNQPGTFHLDLVDVNPRWLLPYKYEFVELLSHNTERIPLLTVPVQSGSDRILRLMRREHCASDVIDFLRLLKDRCPKINLSTQIIVGFSGETEDDFSDTIDLIRSVNFDRVQVFRYADRPKTEAALMPGKIPIQVKLTRLARLKAEFPDICEFIM